MWVQESDMWQSGHSSVGGVSISHDDLAVIKLAVYEFKYDGALHRSGVELFVYGAAHHL